MHTAPDMTDFLVHKTSNLKEYLGLLRYCGSQQQHNLTLCTYLYLVILKNLIQSIFYPVLTSISMETGRSCQQDGG